MGKEIYIVAKAYFYRHWVLSIDKGIAESIGLQHGDRIGIVLKEEEINRISAKDTKIVDNIPYEELDGDTPEKEASPGQQSISIDPDI